MACLIEQRLHRVLSRSGGHIDGHIDGQLLPRIIAAFEDICPVSQKCARAVARKCTHQYRVAPGLVSINALCGAVRGLGIHIDDSHWTFVKQRLLSDLPAEHAKPKLSEEILAVPEAENSQRQQDCEDMQGLVMDRASERALLQTSQPDEAAVVAVEDSAESDSAAKRQQRIILRLRTRVRRMQLQLKQCRAQTVTALLTFASTTEFRRPSLATWY